MSELKVGQEVLVRGRVKFLYADGIVQVQFSRKDPLNRQLAHVEPDSVLAAQPSEVAGVQVHSQLSGLFYFVPDMGWCCKKHKGRCCLDCYTEAQNAANQPSEASTVSEASEEQVMAFLSKRNLAVVSRNSLKALAASTPAGPFDWKAEGYVCAALHRVPIQGCQDCDRAGAAKEAGGEGQAPRRKPIPVECPRCGTVFQHIPLFPFRATDAAPSTRESELREALDKWKRFASEHEDPELADILADIERAALVADKPQPPAPNCATCPIEEYPFHEVRLCNKCFAEKILGRVSPPPAQEAEQGLTEFDDWWCKWKPAWDIQSTKAYIHERESCRAAWNAARETQPADARKLALEWKRIESEMAQEGTIQVPVKWLRAYAEGTVMATCADELLASPAPKSEHNEVQEG